MGALGILGTSSLIFHTMLEETGIDKAIQQRLVMKMSLIAPSDAPIMYSASEIKNGPTQI